MTVTSCSPSILSSGLFPFTVADKLEKSEGIPVEKVRLTERPENLSSNSEILDWDIYQYYKFLAERGDVQIQVMYTEKASFLENANCQRAGSF